MRIALLGPANSIHLQRWAAALVARGHALSVVSQHRVERSLLPQIADVCWLPVDEVGRVRPDAFERALADDPGSIALVTVMWANNEVGTVMPIAELAAIARASTACRCTPTPSRPSPRCPSTSRPAGLHWSIRSPE